MFLLASSLASSLGPLEWLIIVGVPAALMVFGARYVVRRLNSRACPRCGSRVATGVLACESCAYDFATVGSTETP
jgi:hypothetical protein